jgi:hypothetical protein
MVAGKEEERRRAIEKARRKLEKSKLYIPLGVKGFVIAAFKVEESKSVLYRTYKTIEGLHNGITDAIYKEADYISLRIIKRK